jgi:lipoprotein-releasing system permease protein
VSLSRLLSHRYLFSKKQKKLFTVVSILSVLGIAFGVMALLVALSVITGFQKEYKKSLLQFNSHLILMRGDEIAEPQKIKDFIYEKDVNKDVMGLTPFIYREGLAVHKGQVKGVVLKGIKMLDYQKFSHIQINPLETPNASSVPGVYLGSQLAERLHYQTGEIRALFPQDQKDRKVGQKYQSFSVKGTFTTGLYEYDSSFIFLDLNEAQELFHLPDKITGWEIWLHNPDHAEFLKDKLKEGLDWSYILMTWRDLNENLFQALQLEKLLFSIIMMILILVASFNVVVSIVILILEKKGAVAILRTMGAPWWQIRRIFLWEGMTLTGLGVLLGLLLSSVVITILQKVSLHLPPEIYFISQVPVALTPLNIVISSGYTLLICLLAASLALRALNQLNIIKTLQES